AAGLDCVSPECIMEPSKQSSAGDQYSLGCVLYFCLSGRLPFEGSASEKIQAHQSKQPDPIRTVNAEVPEALAKVVDRLLQKAPGDRYFDMNQVIAALSAVVKPIPDSSTNEASVMPESAVVNPAAVSSNIETSVMPESATLTSTETDPLPEKNSPTPPIPPPMPEVTKAIPDQPAATSTGAPVVPVNRESTAIVPPLNP